MKRVTKVLCFGVILLAFVVVPFVFVGEQSPDDLAMPEEDPLPVAPATSLDPAPDSMLYRGTRNLESVDRLVLRARPMDPKSGRYLTKRSATVTGPAVGEIVGAWCRLRAAVAVGCITPGYEIDFYAGKHLISHVELSYGCSNALFDNGRTVEGFDANGDTGVALRQSLDRALGLGRVTPTTRTGPN